MSTPPAGSEINGPTFQPGRSNWNQNSSPSSQPARAGSSGNGHFQADGEMERLARALGWFSLGLGFAQIAAPGKVAQLVGVDDNDETITVMRVLGAREIASGLGILTQPKPAPWLWARVGGDAMDLALLRMALSSPRRRPPRWRESPRSMHFAALGSLPRWTRPTNSRRCRRAARFMPKQQ